MTEISNAARRIDALPLLRVKHIIRSKFAQGSSSWRTNERRTNKRLHLAFNISRYVTRNDWPDALPADLRRTGPSNLKVDNQKAAAFVPPLSSSSSSSSLWVAAARAAAATAAAAVAAAAADHLLRPHRIQARLELKNFKSHSASSAVLASRLSGKTTNSKQASERESKQASKLSSQCVLGKSCNRIPAASCKPFG